MILFVFMLGGWIPYIYYIGFLPPPTTIIIHSTTKEERDADSTMTGRSFWQSLWLDANKEIDSQSIDAVKPIGKYLLAIKLTHYMTVIGFTNAIHFVCSSQTVFSLPFRQIKNCCLVSFVVMDITGISSGSLRKFRKSCKNSEFLRIIATLFLKMFHVWNFVSIRELLDRKVDCTYRKKTIRFSQSNPFSTSWRTHVKRYTC